VCVGCEVVCGLVVAGNVFTVDIDRYIVNSCDPLRVVFVVFCCVLCVVRCVLCVVCSA